MINDNVVRAIKLYAIITFLYLMYSNRVKVHL